MKFAVKLFVIAVLSSLSLSCTSSKRASQIAGRYVQTTKPSTDNQELVLNANGQFTYTLIFDIAGTFKFDGTWSVYNQKVKLLQNEMNNKQQSNQDVLHEEVAPADQKEIKVLDVLNSSPIPGAQINVNESDSRTLVTNAEGIVLLPQSAIKTITIKVFETVDTTFVVKDTLSTRFTAYINIKSPKPWLTSVPTTEWLVKKNKLVGIGIQKEPNTLRKVQ